MMNKAHSVEWALPGGEGGIRTLVPLRETRSPGVRARPNYATSPNDAVRLCLRKRGDYTTILRCAQSDGEFVQE
jgi:hypothetical protein